MKLIADSGSTKTDWRLVTNEGTIEQFRTPGLNPFFVEPVDVAKVAGGFADKCDTPGIWFYGAGCSSPARCAVIEEGLKTVFPDSEIHVDHDLLGAARALCGREPGLAAILGTGSNSCLYDGKDITMNIPALGYILGDEGGGVDIGRRLIRDYFAGNVPQDIRERLEKKFDLSTENVLDRVYQEEKPNEYLASFARYVYQLRPEQYAIDLISDAFRDFLEMRITKYPDYKNLPLNVTGSVGYYNNDILRRVCEEYEVQLGSVVEAPIARMVLYHTGEL